MKRKIIRWTVRILLTVLILITALVCIVLHPSLLYAHKTEVGKFTIYHNRSLDKDLILRLNNAQDILKTSELYDPKINFDICMNDGSYYPSLLEMFLGKAFALGFTSNKVVICGELNCKENYVEVNGQKWNFTQLLAHEETHCLVFHKIGFWRSNPVAKNPKWKWEGYPEYIARKDASQTNLSRNIDQLYDAIKKDKGSWGIQMADSTICPAEYFKFRLLNQYCIEIKGMTYLNLLKDTTVEQSIENEMLGWHLQQKYKTN